MQPVTAEDRFAEWLHAATGYEDITLGPVLTGGNSNVTRVIETRQGRLVLRHPPVNVVSDKAAAVYARAFSRYGTGAAQAMMVGNSIKSDVLPALQAGAWGVHVPCGIPWALDAADPPMGHPRYRELPGLGALVPFVSLLDS